MNKYFAFIDGDQRGPFEPEQLIDAGVRPSTYVWCKGMDDWQRADSVEEIRGIFKRHLIFKSETKTVNEPIETVTPEEVKPQDSVPPQPEQIRFGRIPASVEPEPDYNSPPQVSMTLAILSLILCCPPSGIAAVVFTYKAQKTWEKAMSPESDTPKEELKKAAHEYGRQAKMWLGLTVAFGIILWTLIFSIPK